jgi:hypothetical protein
VKKPKQSKQTTPAALRAEADRIEAEALKAERLADAARIPTCPTCGGREFKIGTWSIVSQTALFPTDPDTDEITERWGDDYESGDHTELNATAECNACGEDVEEILEAHGWRFYDEPEPRS